MQIYKTVCESQCYCFAITLYKGWHFNWVDCSSTHTDEKSINIEQWASKRKNNMP